MRKGEVNFGELWGQVDDPGPRKICWVSNCTNTATYRFTCTDGRPVRVCCLHLDNIIAADKRGGKRGNPKRIR